MYFFRLFIVVFSLQFLLFAQTPQLEKVKLQLQWKYQFQFAGFIIAKENGYYRDAGLDVDIIEYNNTNSIKDLEENKVDYAINNSLLAYSNKKLNKVTLLATYFQRSPLIIITQPEIKSVLDLKGKKVMISENNRYNSSLSVLLDYFNINSKNTSFIKPSFNIQDFIDKKVDAVTAFRSNELFILNKKKIPYNIIDPVEHGFSTNAINLFASYEKVKNNPQQIKKFLAATKKGWEYALSHIKEVAKLIHDKYQPNRSVENLIYEGKVTKELMLLNLYDIGEINSNFVLLRYKQLLKQGKLAKDQDSEKLFFAKTPSSDESINLTPTEKGWIADHRIVSFTGDPNWLPYEAFKDDGTYIGIVSDYLKLIEKHTGLVFKTIPTSSWSESLDIANQGKVKVISGDSADEILNKHFNAIKPYNKNPIVIVMNMKYNYVENLESIGNKKIAIIKNYGYTADIYKRYPEIKFEEVKNIQEGLIGVSEGKYDAMLATMALASYTTAQMGLHNIKIVGKTPIDMDLTLFVSKDEPVLFDIINKTLNKVTQEEKNTILQKWVAQKYVEKIDYTLAGYIALSLLAIIALTLFWIIQLKKEVQKRKKAEKEYQDLYNNSSEMLISVDAKTAKVANCNQTLAHNLGYEKDEIIGEEIFKFYHPDSIEDVKDEFQKFIHSGKVKNAELSVRRKDGTKIDILLNAASVKDKDGNVLRSLSTWTDITERKESEKMLEHIAHYDALTDLPNRALLADRLHLSMAHARRDQSNVIIAYLDLDGFKEINDMYGHDVGDHLLISVSRKMKSILREEDSIARLGGDEFVIVLNDFADVHASTELIERILNIISKPVSFKNLSLKVSASIGITFYPQSRDVDADQLLRQADQAMYQAKLLGKNRYHIFNPDQDESIRGHHQNLDRIKLALEQNEFVLYYQPKVNLRTGEVIGVEALIRWQHPQEGLLAPVHFLPEVEGHHLDVEIGEWVINEAMSQIESWKKSGLNINVSVNISATHIQQSDFIAKIQSFISKHPDISPSNLELEILETTSIENMAQVSDVVTTLTEMGFVFSLDDFGTGYSSLTYLKRLPVQTLKIDKSFVRDMLDDPEDFAIIDGVVGLASAFNRNILAEGMEHIEQAELLLRLGCELVQGFAIAKPMPSSEIANWIDGFEPKPSWKNIEVLHQDKLPILYASIEHRLWIKSISNIVHGQINLVMPMEEDKCRFGKWLDSCKSTDKDILKELQKIHSQVHLLANELIKLHKNGENEKALSKLPELYVLRDKLLANVESLL